MTAEELYKIIPGIPAHRVELFLPYLNLYMPMFGIDNPKKIAAFIAQILHESGGFKYTREIASGKAYEGRKDLGNIYPGDGERFKGRGLIQVTGRTNYRACSKALFNDFSLLDNPDLLSTPKYAVMSACWFWKHKGLNELANKSDNWTRATTKIFAGQRVFTKFEWITVLINGGLNGIAERKKFYERAKIVFDVT